MAAIEYTYWNGGELHESQDTAGLRRVRNLIDEAGRLWKKEHQSASFARYWFDNSGNLSRTSTYNNWNQEQTRLKYAYNGRNRIIQTVQTLFPGQADQLVRQMSFTYGDGANATEMRQADAAASPVYFTRYLGRIGLLLR